MQSGGVTVTTSTLPPRVPPRSANNNANTSVVGVNYGNYTLLQIINRIEMIKDELLFF